MNQSSQHLEDIKVIKRIMEESSRFLSLSGLSGVFMGLFAIAGAIAAKMIIPEGVISGQGYTESFTTDPEGKRILGLLLLMRGGASSGSCCCSLFFVPQGCEERSQYLDPGFKAASAQSFHTACNRRTFHFNYAWKNTGDCFSFGNAYILRTGACECREIYFR